MDPAGAADRAGLALPSVQTLINRHGVWLWFLQPRKDPNEGWLPLINHYPSHACSQCQDCSLLCFATPVRITIIHYNSNQEWVFDDIY